MTFITLLRQKENNFLTKTCFVVNTIKKKRQLMSPFTTGYIEFRPFLR